MKIVKLPKTTFFFSFSIISLQSCTYPTSVEDFLYMLSIRDTKGEQQFLIGSCDGKDLLMTDNYIRLNDPLKHINYDLGYQIWHQIKFFWGDREIKVIRLKKDQPNAKIFSLRPDLSSYNNMFLEEGEYTEKDLNTLGHCMATLLDSKEKEIAMEKRFREVNPIEEYYRDVLLELYSYKNIQLIADIDQI